MTSSSNSRNDQPSWSGTLSFASPESDFVSASKTEHMTEHARNQANWSESLSFASPESDFVSAPSSIHNSSTARNNEWSESLSFASPESDFVSAPETVHVATPSRTANDSVQDIFRNHRLYASPETATGFASYTEMIDETTLQNLLQINSEEQTVPKTMTSETVHVATPSRTANDSVIQDIFRNHRLYASPETATGFVSYTEMIDETTLQTLLQINSVNETVPKTMEDALNDERPIVITTARSPFSVVDVNAAWEGLCGYDRDEAIGQTVGSLLQGPETDMELLNSMVRSMQEDGFSETVITNYTKNGRRFENHLQVGKIPAADDGSNDGYFVGVLNDISEHSNQKVARM